MNKSLVPILVLCFITGCEQKGDEKSLDMVAESEEFEALFDGETLTGWQGNEKTFRVENGAIVAGTLDRPIELDEFLCTTEQFGDFELRLEAKITGDQIAGVQFRGHRVSDSTQVAGYQADMGYVPGEFIPLLSDRKDVDPEVPYPLWGSLLDEYRPQASRYPDPSAPYRLIAVADRNTVENVLRPDDWNQVTITAVGPSIEIHLNGVKTVEYWESEAVPASGRICLQIHSGPPSEASYRNIVVRRIR